MPTWYLEPWAHTHTREISEDLTQQPPNLSSHIPKAPMFHPHMMYTNTALPALSCLQPAPAWVPSGFPAPSYSWAHRVRASSRTWWCQWGHCAGQARSQKLDPTSLCSLCLLQQLWPVTPQGSLWIHPPQADLLAGNHCTPKYRNRLLLQPIAKGSSFQETV